MNQPLDLTNQVFTVTQISNFIKEILDVSFPQITIEGEISGYKPVSSGHVYFTLKDETSQLKAVIFKSSLYNVNFKPKDGDKVRVTGKITAYIQNGYYQIVVSKMERAGVGNILQMLEERKQKLAAQGYFAQEHKQKLPFFPKTIGVVTSPTGAAIRDILQITKRRNPKINIIIFPSLVQGEMASSTICKMIEIANFYSLCDLLIVGRGGGSLEDLLPFSEENVVKAIYDSKIPVISAVGHEIDWALCDYASDVRAATPSAAAEIAIPLISDIYFNLQNNKNELYKNITNLINTKKLLVQNFKPENFLSKFRNIEQPYLQKYEFVKNELVRNMQDKLKEIRNKVTNDKNILINSSPNAIFERGYSMVKIKDTNTILRNTNQITEGTVLEITPAKGLLLAKTDKVIK